MSSNAVESDNYGGPNERDQNMSCFEGLEMGLNLSNFKSNALWGGTVFKNDGTVKGAVRWVRWVRYGGYSGYGTVGTVGTVRWVRWVRWVRYGGYSGYGTVGTVGTVREVRWVRYGGYGGTVR